MTSNVGVLYSDMTFLGFLVIGVITIVAEKGHFGSPVNRLWKSPEMYAGSREEGKQRRNGRLWNKIENVDILGSILSTFEQISHSRILGYNSLAKPRKASNAHGFTLVAMKGLLK